MVAILEALADYAPITKDPGYLAEKARQALGRQLCLQYADDEKVLRVLTMEQALEQKIVDSRVTRPAARSRPWSRPAALLDQGALPFHQPVQDAARSP